MIVYILSGHLPVEHYGDSCRYSRTPRFYFRFGLSVVWSLYGRYMRIETTFDVLCLGILKPFRRIGSF